MMIYHRDLICWHSSAILLLAMFVLSASPAFAQNTAPVMDLPSLLAQESDVRHLPDLPDWTSHLQSSYDRSGGNADFGKFLSIEGRDGVMADMDGPGAIVRIWSANPGGH